MLKNYKLKMMTKANERKLAKDINIFVNPLVLSEDYCFRILTTWRGGGEVNRKRSQEKF